MQTSTTARKRLSSGDGEVNFKKLKVKDETGIIEVGLWREMADTDIKSGDHVELQNFYVSSRYDKNKKMQIPVIANQRKNSSINVKKTLLFLTSFIVYALLFFLLVYVFLTVSIFMHYLCFSSVLFHAYHYHRYKYNYFLVRIQNFVHTSLYMLINIAEMPIQIYNFKYLNYSLNDKYF